MMTLEQIRNRVHAMGDHLGGMAAQIRDDLLAELDRAIEDDAAKEAERALPVTREWMNANFKLECDDDWSVDVGEVRVRMWLRSDGLLRLSVTSSALTVSTRGQLIDLLSGLGVAK